MQIHYDFDRNALGNRLRRARIRAGYPTQEKLADAMSVTPKYISKIETGASVPSLPYILKFADLTKADLNDLLLAHYPRKEFPNRLLKEKPARYGEPELLTAKKRHLIVETVTKTLEEALRDILV